LLWAVGGVWFVPVVGFGAVAGKGVLGTAGFRINVAMASF